MTSRPNRYALALPSSVAYFAARFGRSPLLAFLTFPLIYNFSFSHGFLSFCAGLPTCLWSLVVVDKFLDSPSPRRFAAMVAMTLLTFFMHVVPWLLLGVTVCVAIGIFSMATRRLNDERLRTAAALKANDEVMGRLRTAASEYAKSELTVTELETRKALLERQVSDLDEKSRALATELQELKDKTGKKSRK